MMLSVPLLVVLLTGLALYANPRLFAALTAEGVCGAWCPAVLLALAGALSLGAVRVLRNRHAPPRALLKAANASSAGVRDYFGWVAAHGRAWEHNAQGYHREIRRLLRFLVPGGASVFEAGCADGRLLAAVGGERTGGVDFCPAMLDAARKRCPTGVFLEADVDSDDWTRSLAADPWDYVVMSDLLGSVYHVQHVLQSTHALMHEQSRLVLTTHNYAWEPLLKVLEWLRYKMPTPRGNWLSSQDLTGMLLLAGFEVVKSGTVCLLPARVPLVAWVCNRVLVHLPLFRHFGVVQYVVARRRERPRREYSVSVVVPARNESGNIEAAVLRTPAMGKGTELIFVEGNSTDDTWETMQRVKETYGAQRSITVLRQDGKGKGDAVRKGFAAARGEMVTILDADLTMPPEELPRFYEVLASGYADFVNGSRLVYRPENEAMRFFNILGNKFFSLAFSWLLGQPLKDTLCGTKMLLREDYERIVANRAYFGEFDPFGDFDLLFGAAKLNLKIVDLPIHYKARTYGDTNIDRWKHGVILLRMVVFAMRKIRFI